MSFNPSRPTFAMTLRGCVPFSAWLLVGGGFATTCRDSIVVDPCRNVQVEPLDGDATLAGDRIELRGMGLDCIVRVSVGGADAQISTKSPESLVFATPDSRPGEVAVALWTGQGTSISAGRLVIGQHVEVLTGSTGTGHAMLADGREIEIRAADLITNRALPAIVAHVFWDGTDLLAVGLDPEGGYFPTLADLSAPSVGAPLGPHGSGSLSSQALILDFRFLERAEFQASNPGYQPIAIRQQYSGVIRFLYQSLYTFAYAKPLGDIDSDLENSFIWALARHEAGVSQVVALRLGVPSVVLGVHSLVGFVARDHGTRMVERYRQAGYQDDQIFEVYHSRVLFNPDILVLPTENPRSPPPRTGQLRGRLLDAMSSLPIPQGRVEGDGATSFWLAVTSEDGTFSSPDIAAGPYNVLTTAPGYRPERLLDLSISGATDLGIISLVPFDAAIAGTYSGPVDETSEGIRLTAVFTFDITQDGGILLGAYSISGTVGAESVTGTGTLSGTIAVGTNPEVNLTSTSNVCPSFSNEFRGTYDGTQRVITLTGTVHIFRINTCALIAAYPNTVIRFTREGALRLTDRDHRRGMAAGS